MKRSFVLLLLLSHGIIACNEVDIARKETSDADLGTTTGDSSDDDALTIDGPTDVSTDPGDDVTSLRPATLSEHSLGELFKLVSEGVIDEEELIDELVRRLKSDEEFLAAAKGQPGIALQWLGTYHSDPALPMLNQAYYNAIDGIAYVYDGEAWQVLAMDGKVGEPGSIGAQGPIGAQGETGQPGFSLSWKGELPAAPADPEPDWVYFNTTEQASYFFDTSGWHLLARSSALSRDDDVEIPVFGGFGIDQVSDIGYGVCNQVSPVSSPFSWGPYSLTCFASADDCLTKAGNQSDLGEIYGTTGYDGSTVDWSELFGCTNGGHCCSLDYVCPDGGTSKSDYADICPQVNAYNQVIFARPPENHPPVIDPLPDHQIDELVRISFKVEATDQDGDDIIFSVFDLPQGAIFDNTTALFDWTPGLDDEGLYSLKFRAADPIDDQLFDGEWVQIQVADNPYVRESYEAPRLFVPIWNRLANFDTELFIVNSDASTETSVTVQYFLNVSNVDLSGRQVRAGRCHHPGEWPTVAKEQGNSRSG